MMTTPRAALEELDDERKAFEADHCGNVGGLIRRNSTTDDYVLPSINDAWSGWKSRAARAILAEPAPVVGVASSLHAAILSLPHKPYDGTDAYTHYCRGFSEACAAAAELVRATLPASGDADGAMGGGGNRTTVDSGALTLALNVLRRAGKDEVADALAATGERLTAASPDTGAAVEATEKACPWKDCPHGAECVHAQQKDRP